MNKNNDLGRQLGPHSATKIQGVALSADQLSPASRAVLTQIVLGRVVHRIPSELLQLKLVRAETLHGRDGWSAMAFVATKAGRIAAAMEDGE